MTEPESSTAIVEEGSPLIHENSVPASEIETPKSTGLSILVIIGIIAVASLSIFFVYYQPGVGMKPSNSKDEGAGKSDYLNKTLNNSTQPFTDDDPIKNINGKFSPLLDCSGYCRTYVDKYTPIITTKKPNMEKDEVEKQKKSVRHSDDKDSSVENSVRSHEARKKASEV